MLLREQLDGLHDLVVLLVSELVTNAVLHARTDAELVIARRGSRLRVQVEDAEPERPVPRGVDPTAMTGRGLALVARLATDWGVDVRPGGKSVWFEVDLDRPAELG